MVNGQCGKLCALFTETFKEYKIVLNVIVYHPWDIVYYIIGNVLQYCDKLR